MHGKRVPGMPPSETSRPLRLPTKAIGRGRATARGLPTKPAIKQVDRRLINQGVDIDAAPFYSLCGGTPR
jgi:hypothetical protein